MSDPDKLTPEDVDEALTAALDEAVLQTNAGHLALWSALADLLVIKCVVDQDELIAFISIASQQVTPEGDGSIYRAITRGVMRSLAQMKYGAQIPPEVEAVITDREPIHTLHVTNGRGETVTLPKGAR